MKAIFIFFAFLSLYAQAQTKGGAVQVLTRKSFLKVSAPLQLLTLGELHGTQEAPKTIGNIARQLNRKGRVVQVGLEVPLEEQGLVDQFYLSGDTGLFRKSPFFITGPKDGRSSQAMVQLLITLRHAGIAVFCFERRGKTSQERDSLMAREVEQKLSPDKLTILLVGNVHARREAMPIDTDRSPFYPMMSFLEKGRTFKVMSLNLWFGEGDAWLCMEEGCKVQRLSVRTDLKARFGKRSRYVLSKEKAGYDGFIYVPKATPSYPFLKPVR